MPDTHGAGDDQEHRDDEAPPPRCRACNRPISDPDSLATGLGRDCRARHTTTRSRNRRRPRQPLRPGPGQLDLTDEEGPAAC